MSKFKTVIEYVRRKLMLPDHPQSMANVSSHVMHVVSTAVNTSNHHITNDITKYLCRLVAAPMDLSICSTTTKRTTGSSSSSNKWTVVSVFHPGNHTRADIPDYSDHGILVSVLVVILVTALFGNALVLGTLAYNRSSWTNMDISVLSLAVSDVLVSMTCVPLLLDQVINPEWTFGVLSCRAIPFFMQLAVSANMLTLCFLAVDRYLAIVYPLKFNTFKSMRTTQVLIVLAWIVSLVGATPSALRYDIMKVCGRLNTDGTCQQDFKFSLCLNAHNKSNRLVPHRTVKWTSFVTLFVCPTLVMGVAYGIIIYTLWVKANLGMVGLSAAALRNRHKKKAVKMLVLVVSLFIFSWAPLKIWSLVAAEKNLNLTLTTKTVDLVLKCLAMSSTAYNPMIYAFMNQKFRANFKNILQFRKRRARVGPHLLVNDTPEFPRRQHHPHHHRHHHHLGHKSAGKDGTESQMSNNNDTTVIIPGDTQKTTSTKLTTGSSTRQNNTNNTILN